MGDAHFSRDGVESSLFVLKSPLRSLQSVGRLAFLPSGSTATLAARVAAFFAERRQGPALLVGALPFDFNAADALFQPARVMLPNLPAESFLPAFAGVCAEPSPEVYADSVVHALQHLQEGGDASRKVVLARTLRVQATEPVNPLVLASRLGSDPSVAAYVVPVPAGVAESAWLVGATPELLISRRGLSIASHPLAGSARRSADPVEDARAAECLLTSEKDLEEHRYVVDAIVEALSPLCAELDVPVKPSLHATATMWHLGTHIKGRLNDASVSAAALAGLLHPTPAVCGTPRASALKVIKALEPVDRGFYAGAVGWVDADGDGDWYVAIRCAHVQGAELRLFAGAGIVAGSRPEAEVDETAGKFMAMLNALGIRDALGSSYQVEL